MKRALAPRLLTVTLVVLALAVAGPASAKRRGGPGMAPDGPSESHVAIRQLKQQIAAEELLIALDLDADQKVAITALVTRMVDEHEARKAEREAEAPKLQALLEDYLAEVRADGVPTTATAEALRSFRQGHRPDPEARRGDREGGQGGAGQHPRRGPDRGPSRLPTDAGRRPH